MKVHVFTAVLKTCCLLPAIFVFKPIMLTTYFGCDRERLNLKLVDCHVD